MKKIINTVWLLFSMSWIYGQVPGTWMVNPSNYQNQMNVTCKLNQACTDLNNANNTVAAFVNGQCRGLAGSTVEVNGKKLAYLTVYSNIVGEKVILKVYNAATNSVFQAYDTITFNINGLGGPASPYLVTENYAPTNITLSSYSFLETISIGTTIATLSATDNDATNAFTFTLPAGQLENNKYTINGNSLQANSAFRNEVDPKDTIRIMVRDAKNCTYTKDILLTINDGNDPPTDIKFTFSALNDQDPPGKFVGKLTTTDSDLVDTYTYTLGSCNPNTHNASFIIKNDSVFTSSIVYHDITPTFTICIRTTDAGGFDYQKSFQIPVIDSHDPSDITIDTLSIKEGNATGFLISKLKTTDGDPGDTFTYSLMPGSGDGDNAEFTITGDKLYITTTTDYESKNTYHFRIKSSDAKGAATEKPFTLTIEDKNEAPTDITFVYQSLNDQDPAGFFLGKLATTDEDRSDKHTYTLGTCSPNVNNIAFVIRNDSVFTKNKVLHDVTPVFNICIRTTDNSGLFYQESFRIMVIDSHDPSDIIIIDTLSIVENNAAHSYISKIQTVDGDNPDSFTYTLVAGNGSEDNSQFYIKDDELYLLNTTDYETKNTYQFRVRSSDQKGTSTEKSFTLNIEDVNEPPTDIIIPTLSIKEANTANFYVSKIQTIDGDVDTFKYSLVSGSGDDDNTQFSITGDKLYLSSITDYEVKSIYHFRVRSTDASGAFTEKRFSLTVEDVNEPPTDIVINTLSMKEGNALNFNISSINTIDGDVDTFTYELVSGSGDEDNAQLYIEGNKLYMAYKTNYDVKNAYNFRVRSTDARGAFIEKSFTVLIEDVLNVALSLPSLNYLSPNGDGKNDYWEVQNVEIYKNFSLHILDPFGNIVFKKENNYNNEWDGTRNGKLLPDGNYYYVFKNDKKTYTGSITIVNQ